MKIIFVLLDGIGDRSYSDLGHRTPLQAAATPHLDRLALMGSNGLFHTALLGQCLPSETAHYLLFGYALEQFPGRGLLEAVGEGVSFDDGDVLCLAHLASVSCETGEPVLVQKRPDLEDTELERLFSAISSYDIQEVRLRLQQTHRNDAILIISGSVSPHISDSDPMIPGRVMASVWPIADNPEPERAAVTARALNAYLIQCYNTLSRHEVNRLRQSKGLPPANFLATQRCGRRIVQEPFEQRWGMAGMLVASGSVYGGLAKEIGLTFVQAKDSPDPGADIRERIRLALSDSSHDFIHVHTKVPDEAAHTGDPRRKMAAIEALDQGLDELVAAAEARDDLLVVITADHSTPSVSPLIHSGEPVPVALVGKHVRRDEVAAFDEVHAAGGCLGILRGQELMLMVLNYADRSALLGHRLGRANKPYVPQTYPSFKLTE